MRTTFLTSTGIFFCQFWTNLHSFYWWRWANNCRVEDNLYSSIVTRNNMLRLWFFFTNILLNRKQPILQSLTFKFSKGDHSKGGMIMKYYLKKLKMFGVRGVNQAWFRRYFSPWKELKEGKFHFLFKSFHLHTALKRLSFVSVFYVCLLVKKHAKLEKFKYSIQNY